MPARSELCEEGKQGNNSAYRCSHTLGSSGSCNKLSEESEAASAKLTSWGSRNIEPIRRMPRWLPGTCARGELLAKLLRKELMAERLCELLMGQDYLLSASGHGSPSAWCPNSCGGNKTKKAYRILGDFIGLLAHAIVSPNPVHKRNPKSVSFLLHFVHFLHCSPNFSHMGLLCFCLECVRSH